MNVPDWQVPQALGATIAGVVAVVFPRRRLSPVVLAWIVIALSSGVRTFASGDPDQHGGLRFLLVAESDAIGPKVRVRGTGRSVQLGQEILDEKCVTSAHAYSHVRPLKKCSDDAQKKCVTERKKSYTCVTIALNEEGAAKLREATSRSIGRQIAVVLDGTAVAVYVVAHPQTGTTVNVMGWWGQAESKRIAARIEEVLRQSRESSAARGSGS